MDWENISKHPSSLWSALTEHFTWSNTSPFPYFQSHSSRKVRLVFLGDSRGKYQTDNRWWKCLEKLFNFNFCLFFFFAVTNKKPSHVSITKVKQFHGSSAFVKRSQWTMEQLRQVNGIDSNKVSFVPSTICTPLPRLYTLVSHAVSGLLLKDCPEFDLMFENAFDQWVAGSAGEKCTFIQVLHHTCQRYSSARKPEFINCQSKLLGGKTIEANAANAANAKRRRCCPFGARWLCHARLAAVAMCCEPVSLCAMVPGDTWYTRGSMNITQAARQCNTSCSPRIYIAHFKLKLPLIINLP